MALAIHILLVWIGLLLTVVGCRLYGSKPNVRRVLGGLVAAFLSVIAQSILCVYTPEGNYSPLPLFLGGCMWLVASMITVIRKQLCLAVALVVFFFGLTLQHQFLVTTPNYTDSPSERQSAIDHHNQRDAKAGKPLSPPVQIHAHWYTLFTGLYTVDPPTNIHPTRPL